jgi:hypothetical protein
MTGFNTSKVTRVELTDETGRVYVRYNAYVTIQSQDDERTLKVFVTPRPDFSKQDVSKLDWGGDEMRGVVGDSQGRQVRHPR